MYDTGKEYWFQVEGNGKNHNIKGRILEEDDHAVKIENRNGVSFIVKRRILNVNEARNIEEL